MLRNNFYVFDYDGTIEYKGEVSKENFAFISSIKNKVLNTSRSFEEIPEFIKNEFKYIMCLGGSLYYENGKLAKAYKTISNKKVQELVGFALKNEYNISFNSTKSKFFNVKNKSSIDFMDKVGIKHEEDIDIPKDVYQIAISSSEVVKDFSGSIRQSIRFIEYSVNDKGNIANHFSDFIAVGDGENDKPMFAKAKKFYLVEGAILSNIK